MGTDELSENLINLFSKKVQFLLQNLLVIYYESHTGEKKNNVGPDLLVTPLTCHDDWQK